MDHVLVFDLIRYMVKILFHFVYLVGSYAYVYTYEEYKWQQRTI